jgi:polysaccharide export outer membrane protein
MLTGVAVVAAMLAGGYRAAAAQQAGGANDLKADSSRTPAGVTVEYDPYFKEIYRSFYENYRLGPEDEIAIRVIGQPDYSLERTRITPFGRIYHPLVGEIEVVGLTVSQATGKLTSDLSEYIIDPKVSISLLAANSAKVGVLGEVSKPGILVMTRPLTLLDAISATGGVTDFGSEKKVTVLRNAGRDEARTMTVNLKRILQAKAGAEENITLQAGDTVIVHGNFKKTFATITRLAGFGYFIRNLAGY